MNTIVLSLVLAFAGYSVQNISQASQKLGFIKMEENKRRGVLFWGFATMGTGLSALILLVAVSLGQVSLVGAMAGTGLVSLTLYSRFVLKDHIGRNEITGICLIILAAVFIGIFADEASVVVIEIKLLTIKLIIVSLTYGILWVVFFKKEGALCVIIGGFAGALGGFVSQFQKISTSVQVEGDMVTDSVSGFSALMNPFTLIWILISICSMIVLQFAHKNGKPLRVIPAFSANYILIPVIGGVTCFGEVLHPVQWLGIGIIIAGVLIITIKKGS
jgi:uncharacterized membrane protein